MESPGTLAGVDLRLSEARDQLCTRLRAHWMGPHASKTTNRSSNGPRRCPTTSVV